VISTVRPEVTRTKRAAIKRLNSSLVRLPRRCPVKCCDKTQTFQGRKTLSQFGEIMFCQCEHRKHEKVSSIGEKQYICYNAGKLISVPTPNGTYCVCRDCADSCLADMVRDDKILFVCQEDDCGYTAFKDKPNREEFYKNLDRTKVSPKCPRCKSYSFMPEGL
jgi:hypothetical protein